MKQHPNDVADVGQVTAELLEGLASVAGRDEDALPEIGPEIYDRLPARLRRLCDTMEAGVERAIFLTSSLPVLAGFMVNVRGRCGDGRVSLCLYTMVYGLAGSGKGALRYARRLAEVTDARLFEESRAEIARWEVSRDAGTMSDTPEPPKRRFYAAGNSSAAAMAETLAANGGRAVICESEMASITGAMGQDWGRAVADLLLRCYQGEPVTIDRKSGSIRVNDPALCVAMTGTPASLAVLLPSAESGLLSRCMIYRIDPLPRWISQAPTERKTERDDLIREESRALDDLHSALSSRSDPLLVHMTTEQWDVHTRRFEEELKRLCAAGLPRTMEAAVKRAGNNAFRLACTLAVLRCSEMMDLSIVESVVVNDAEAVLGIDLALIYLAHSIEYAAHLPIDKGANIRTIEKAAWLASLPDEFRTTEALEEGARRKISRRTIMRWLPELAAVGRIEHVAHGLYRKCPIVSRDGRLVGSGGESAGVLALPRGNGVEGMN
jgi:hypothetical protein